MKLILRKDVEKVGKSGETVSVKDGFARNYLLPKGLALVATQDNLKRIESEKKKVEQSKKTEKNKALELAKRISNFSCTISAEAKDDNLYGSVTALDIYEALKDEDIGIEKQDVLLVEPIKKLGIYEVEVRLHPEVATKIKVWVVKK
jgi:large subunit ribosomal protein L9